MIAQWELVEYLGLSWPEQVISLPLRDSIPNGLPLRIADAQGRIVPAQREGDRVLFATGLPAHERKRFHLETGDAPPTGLKIESGDGVLALRNALFGLRIGWGTGCPAPIAQICGADGQWFGQGAWDCLADCRSFHCDMLAAGPVVAMARQVYVFDTGIVTWTYRLDATAPVVRIDLSCTGQAACGAVWDFGDFAPTHAFWRPHSTEDWRGPKAAYHRQVYAIRQIHPPDEVCLQPFYNWNRNGAMFWSCWADEGHQALMVGAVRPSQTRVSGAFQPLCVRNGQGLCIPVQEGQTSFVLGMLDRGGDAAHRVEAWYRQGHGLDLDAYARMDVDWEDDAVFPRLFIAPGDLPHIRKRARDWDWFCEAFRGHVEDRLFFSNAQPDLKMRPEHAPLGQDPAGAYLASGEPKYAERAFASLERQLDTWVRDMAALGPTVDALIGFAFAGPFRAAGMVCDLIADALQADVRRVLLRKIAFLTEVFFSKDAWPDLDTGMSRGNLNFHASVVCARGLAAALLNGHPKQRVWLEQARREAAAFLRAYHFDSGCAREALTYQFNVVAQFTLLSMALRRAGLADLFETEPVLKQSFDFLSSVQTPRDPRVGFCMLPTVGHVTSYGWGQSLQACFAWAAKATAHTDACFSARMMAAWRRAGSPAISLHDFYHGQIWWPPLCLIDPSLPAHESAHGSRIHPGLGAVFRGPKDGYVLVKMGPSRGHYDPDEGSILWYAHGKPLLADFGCQYNPNIACAHLHNRIGFEGWHETGDHAFDILAHHTGRYADAIAGAMRVTRLHRWADRPIRDAAFDFRALPGPRDIAPVVWRREVVYVRGCEALIIHDCLEGDLATDWHLQVFAEEVQITDSRVACRGQFGVDLDVYMALPEAWSISGFEHLGFDEPRLPSWWWRGANWATPAGAIYGPVGERALTLSIPPGIRSEYLALLIARPVEQQAPDVAQSPDGFTWQHGEGRWTARLREKTWLISFDGASSWQEDIGM